MKGLRREEYTGRFRVITWVGMFLNSHLHISHDLADVKPVNLFNLEMKVLLNLSFLLK